MFESLFKLFLKRFNKTFNKKYYEIYHEILLTPLSGTVTARTCHILRICIACSGCSLRSPVLCLVTIHHNAEHAALQLQCFITETRPRSRPRQTLTPTNRFPSYRGILQPHASCQCVTQTLSSATGYKILLLLY